MSGKQSELTVTLKYPFKNGAGDEVKVITLRRPVVRDIREMLNEYPGNSDMQGYSMAQKLSGLVYEDFDLMDAADFKVVMNLVTAIIS